MKRSDNRAHVRAHLAVLSAALLAAALVLSGCQGGAETPESDGRYTHGALTTGIGTNTYSTDPPGSSTLLPREYPGAPPLVPHSLEGLQIDRNQNACMGCHLAGISFGADHTATLIPESHYVDQATGERSDEVQAIRYGCLLCHLPQSPEEAPRQ
jgi:cytochrome c-type protein NapB